MPGLPAGAKVLPYRSNIEKIADFAVTHQNTWLFLTRLTITQQFHFLSNFFPEAARLKGEAPIDDVNLTRGVAGFVRG